MVVVTLGSGVPSSVSTQTDLKGNKKVFQQQQTVSY